MKRLYIFLTLALTAIIASGSNKHYKLEIPNPEKPGETIVYEIEEPSVIDYRTHFIVDFLKTLPPLRQIGISEIRSKTGGTLKVVFLLDKDGFIHDTQIVEKSGFSYEYNLVSIFNSAEPISPGLINGEPAVFSGYLEMTIRDLNSIKVYWTPLIGVEKDADID